jgi:hypothetical protein
MRSTTSSTTNIVADGRFRIQNTPEYREAAAEIRARVYAEQAPLMKKAGVLQGLYLRAICEWRILRRIEALAETLAPRDALYLQPPGSRSLRKKC